MSCTLITKRAVYHHCSKNHGHRYYNEIAYRLTEGSVKIPVMFRIRKLARKTFEVQLTYNELTRKSNYSVCSGGMYR